MDGEAAAGPCAAVQQDQVRKGEEGGEGGGGEGRGGWT